MIQVFDGDGLDTRVVTFRMGEPTINTVNEHDSHEFRWGVRRSKNGTFNFKAPCCTLVFGIVDEAVRVFKGMRQCAIDGIQFDVEFIGDVPCFHNGIRAPIRSIRGYGIVHYGSFEGGQLFMTIGKIEQCRLLHKLAGEQPLPTRGISSWVWDEA